MQTKGIDANQVVTRIHANQGHCYANQVVTEIRTNQGHLCKSDRYIWKSEYKLVRYSLGKEGKRNKARKRTNLRKLSIAGR